MSGKSVDDLVGALFPGEKLPPSTNNKTATSIGDSWKPKPKLETKAYSTFDDSEDENSPKRQQQTNNNKPLPTTTTSTPSLPITKSSTNTNTNHSLTMATNTKSSLSSSGGLLPKASSIWPTLPKNLLRSCDEGTVILTNQMSQRDAATHHKVLFPSPTTTQEDIMAERDTSIIGGLAGEVQYCSYIRCRKCGHPVVRLQNAYIKAPQNNTPNTDSKPTTQVAAPVASNTVSTGSAGGHNFDDSSDEEETKTPASASATPLTAGKNGSQHLLDEMYMLCRNHFPDFLALERTGKMKRLNDCAIYWCQCTCASVCFASHKRVQLKTGLIVNSNENGKLLELSEETVRTKMDGEAPFSTREICWECVGHHKPLM